MLHIARDRLISKQSQIKFTLYYIVYISVWSLCLGFDWWLGAWLHFFQLTLPFLLCLSSLSSPSYCIASKKSREKPFWCSGAGKTDDKNGTTVYKYVDKENTRKIISCKLSAWSGGIHSKLFYCFLSYSLLNNLNIVNIMNMCKHVKGIRFPRFRHSLVRKSS